MPAAIPAPLCADFPEEQFPPAAWLADSYDEAVERGRRAMAGSRAVLCGLARNVGQILPLTMARLERLGAMFGDYRIFLYENDSEDDTPRQLAAWAAADRRVVIRSETRGLPRHPSIRSLSRAADMADYRNRCQEEIARRWSDFDYAIVIDTDLAEGFSYEGIAHSFGSQPWDFVGANGIVHARHRLALRALHYDVWAYRAEGDWEPLGGRTGNALLWTRGEPLVPVYSCFGGVGLYRMEAWLSARYGGEDCEHVTLHRAMRRAGFGRQFLNPSQIALYGRKEKQLDALLLGLGRMVSAVAGVFAW
jgi:hypothetical protein